MKKTIVGLLLVPLFLLLSVSTVNATQPNFGTGHVSLTDSVRLSHQVIGHNTLVVFKNTFVTSGALAGKAVAIERDLIHNQTGVSIDRGLANFTGTLGDKSGTLVIRYEGRNNGTFIRGHFEIFGGTGQLAGVRGHGAFEGKATFPPTPLNYSLRWHVATGTHDTEVNDQTKAKAKGRD
ncbi:MAG TPA: DUF3224 domain-containing protein [Candidatus Bathyarchaeia archaeon]|nr:DUF3224 domain-containing protein [Candidatus Bathyarchaeia archaeon]